MRVVLLRVILAITASALLAVTAFAAPAGAKVSGPNGQIVFARFNPALGDTVIYTVNPDGSDLERLSPGNFGFAESPHWSPDGSNVAFFSGAGGQFAAVIANPDAGTFRQLPMQEPATLFTDCHIWSPDAARLACDSFGQSDPSLNGIYTIRSSDGGDLTKITSNPGGDDSPCDYSPDGTHLVFDRTNPDGSSELDTVNMATGAVQQLAPAGTTLTDLQCGSWSPQDNQILFAARPTAGQRRAIYVVNSDGTGLHELPITPACGGARTDPTSRGCQDPSWSPDGTKIVFDIYVLATGMRSIYTANADGSGLFQVTHIGIFPPRDRGEGDESPDWGPHPITG
jgi:Tol biopolymer transport system component